VKSRPKGARISDVTQRCVMLKCCQPKSWPLRTDRNRGKQHGASDYFITLGQPLHNNVTGNSAYVAVPATMTFKVRGEQVTQSGAVFTVALRKLAEGWRIAAWAWAKGTPR
jgi:hypothetical protein